MTPPVICIVGKNKNDKTRLIEALIQELKSRGLHIGALKRHKHGDFAIDIEGKDSWKYSKAGAQAVVISSPVKLAVIKRVREEMEIDELCTAYLADTDIVLADGFTLSSKPRIIVADTYEEIELFGRDNKIVEVVGKAGLGYDEVSILADKIERFMKHSQD